MKSTPFENDRAGCDYTAWRGEVERLLAQLKEIDFGYPFGENTLREPALDDQVVTTLEQIGLTDATDLLGFYSVCNGLNWPDVHNGYFIKQHESLRRSTDEYEPTRIEGNVGGAIVTIGSSGGGSLFAIRKNECDVVVLPAGRIERNIYFDSEGAVRVVATRFAALTDALLHDLGAFVHDVPEHVYLA